MPYPVTLGPLTFYLHIGPFMRPKVHTLSQGRYEAILPMYAEDKKSSHPICRGESLFGYYLEWSG